MVIFHSFLYVYQRVNLVGINWLNGVFSLHFVDDWPCHRCRRSPIKIEAALRIKMSPPRRPKSQPPGSIGVSCDDHFGNDPRCLTHVHWCFHMVIIYVYIYIYIIYIYIIYIYILHSFSIDVSIDVFHMLHQVHRKDDPEPTPEPTAEATADAEEPAMEVPLWKKMDRGWFLYIYT